MEKERRIPYLSTELTPEQLAGLVPDGNYHGINEFLYPDYPDLPYPENIDKWDYNNDPLIYNDELAPRQDIWDPADPHAPWREPH